MVIWLSEKLQLMISLAEPRRTRREFLCAPSALCERIFDLLGTKKFRIAHHWSEPDNQIL